VPFDVFTVDHIIPLSKGGAHAVANLQLAHLACNIRKGNRISLQE
jgi:5-methylcytosine-specific restriction endonuclease McrA